MLIYENLINHYITFLHNRQMLLATEKAGKLYEECSQDIDLCPTAFDIGCVKPEPCKDCMVTTTTTNGCGCQEMSCGKCLFHFSIPF